MIGTTWTMGRIALLKERICAGFSCGQIARELGVSRNAVIGKTNRLGLSRFKSAITGQLKQSGLRKNAHSRIVTQRAILRGLSAPSQLALPEVPRESVRRPTLCSNFSSGIAAGLWATPPLKISVSAVTGP